MTRRTRVLSSLLAISLLASLSPSFESRAKPDNDSLRINRLIGLCRLWGYVKYFHPALAYRTDIDWDAALVEAIPGVRNADGPEEYAAALAHLLRTLGDPSTRINSGINSAAAGPEGPAGDNKLDYRMAADGILVITAGNYFELWSRPSQERLNNLAREVVKAKGIVFDLRTAEPAGEYGRLQLISSFAPIERLISSAPITTPGERVRVHRGLENSSAFSSGQYRSGFYIQNVKRIFPVQDAKDVRCVFLLNKNSALLESAVPLQSSGRALIVFDGDPNENSIVRVESLDLGEGVSARVRVADAVLEDGSSGELQADGLVAESPKKDPTIGVETALRMLRDFGASSAIRKRLPSNPVTMPEKPYSHMKYPTLEYRLLAAFRIWNAVEYFFPYKALMERDWADVLREMIPKFDLAANALEYSLTVAEMMTHLHDSHAYVSGSVLNEHFGSAYPPIRVRMVESSPVVTHLYDQSIASSAGVEIGDIVLKVDGEDAKQRLTRYARYISASTPHSRMDKASLTFMNGADKSPVRLTIRGRDNRDKEVTLRRKPEDFTTLYHRERSGEIVRLLPGNIGYVDLDRMTLEMIDPMLDRLKNTRGIIFDMRGYPNSAYWALPQRLTDKTGIAAALIETPLAGRSFSTPSFDSSVQTIFPRSPDKLVYRGSTVMLIDERTVSQAEHTGLFLRAANGTKFIGSPTAGANGEITTFSLPGGIGTGFSGQSVRHPDGRQLQRVGLVPDIEIRPTIKGIRAGRDEVLDRAVRYLIDR